GDNSLGIGFKQGLVLDPGETVQDAVELTYKGRKATSGNVKGTVIVMTNNTNLGLSQLEIPYTVQVLHGGVGFDRMEISWPVPLGNASEGVHGVTNLRGMQMHHAHISNFFPENLELLDAFIEPSETCSRLFATDILDVDGRVAAPHKMWNQ
ncbi:unnamed protein product, partial [Chrysoparadoxa australica]